MSLWLFKRREWENRGRYFTNAEIAANFNKWFGAPVPISFTDPGKRAIEQELFEELAAKYSRLIPPHLKKPKCDCDKRVIMRSGDILRGWAFESKGDDALNFGWMDLHHVGATEDHECLWWMGPDRRVGLYNPTDTGIAVKREYVDKLYRVRA